ncbi:MAG: thiamine-phosphate kinase [Candidatus Dormiibacterota bacterium]
MSTTGETDLLRQLMELAGDSSGQAEIGPGDDAAAWQPTPGGLVLWSTDSLCEDVDFRRKHQTPYQVGWKAWMAAVSDLSAMGARPRAGLVAALLPVETSTEAVLAIQCGLVDAAAVDGAAVTGGDVSRSAGPLSVTVTVLGEVTDGSPVKLSGGRVGDRILVTGALGMAGAALERLEEGGTTVPEEWLERLRMPPSRVRAGMALRRAGSSAMTDLSDGLLLDLDRLSQASGVGADLWLDQIPRGTRLEDTERGGELALTGGEDYELLATVPEPMLGELLDSWDDELPRLSVVGVLSAKPGTRLFSESGGELIGAPSNAGFRHF